MKGQRMILDNNGPLSLWVYQLVEKIVPNGNKKQLVQYVFRILCSRLTVIQFDDEYSLLALMKKYLINNNSLKSAIELDQLYNRLLKIKSFNRINGDNSNTSSNGSIGKDNKIKNNLRFSTLYLLYQLREQTGNEHAYFEPTLGIKKSNNTNVGDKNLYTYEDMILTTSKLMRKSSGTDNHKMNGESHKFDPHTDLGTNGFNNLSTDGVDNLSTDGVDKKRFNSNTNSSERSDPNIPNFKTDQISQEELIRDLIFVIQGLDGNHIKYSIEKDRYDFENNAKVNKSHRLICLRISELGWLFRKVIAYLEFANKSKNLGLIEQSFRDGLLEEILLYYKMIAVLESQLYLNKNDELKTEKNNLKSKAMFNSHSNGSNESECHVHDLNSDTDNRIPNNTLIKFFVWISEPFHRMKWLATVIEYNSLNANDISSEKNTFYLNRDEKDLYKSEEPYKKLDMKSKDDILNRLKSSSQTIDPSKSKFIENVSFDGKNKDHSHIAVSRLSQLTQMRLHGAPYFHSLGKKLEHYTSRPLLFMIQNWIFQGVLNDPFKEYFVIKNQQLRNFTSEDGKSKKIYSSYFEWDKQYLLVERRIPPFIGQKMAEKIFLLGKTLNFLKNCCGDEDWIIETITRQVNTFLKGEKKKIKNYKSDNFSDLMSFGYSVNYNEQYNSIISKNDLIIDKFDQLKPLIYSLYELFNYRLVQLISDKFNLIDHSRAIRNYLFLGYGDLVQSLMENLGQDLDLPPGKQFRHNVLPILESSIRSTIANNLPKQIQENFDIYLPNESINSAGFVNKFLSQDRNLFYESKRNYALINQLSYYSKNIYNSVSPTNSGWDCLELFYKMSSPIDSVLGNEIVCLKHRAISKFLWRLRRAQFTLSSIWKVNSFFNKQLLPLLPETRLISQQSYLLRYQMNHFVSNIQYYILFEVIESAWKVFFENAKRASTLDALIEFYNEYLDTIINLSLIEEPKMINELKENGPSHIKNPISNNINNHNSSQSSPASMISDIIDTIFQLENIIKSLSSAGNEVAFRREESLINAEKNETPSKNDSIWKSKDDELLDAQFCEHLESTIFVDFQSVVDKYTYTFNKFFTFVAQSMMDGENIYLRYLFQRINFNSYYAHENLLEIITPTNLNEYSTPNSQTNLDSVLSKNIPTINILDRG